jgi:DNA-binding transcriptional regulator YdaS (Cro superfamily)
MATHRRSRKGEWIERKTPIGTYFCPQPHKELRSSICPKTINAKQAETQIWEKVCQFITNPDYLLAQAKAKVTQLQKEIKKLTAERQEFITKARRGQMADQEFTPQISALYDKELGVKRKLTAIEYGKDVFTKLDLEEQVKQYVADLQVEMAELIHANPQTLEERHQVFLLKKQIVDTVLEEARIDENREIHVKFRTDFLNHAG